MAGIARKASRARLVGNSVVVKVRSMSTRLPSVRAVSRRTFAGKKL